MSEYVLPLDGMPDGAALHGVTAQVDAGAGRTAVRVSLSEAVRAGVYGVDFVDQPTFVLLPVVIANGSIEVDLHARILPGAPDYARGFAGLAYRVQPERSAYESVYLRPTNGWGQRPPAPRHERAVQYYAYPDWPFDRLRAESPGQYEAGADISVDKWHRLRVDLDDQHVTASVDGRVVLGPILGKVPAAVGTIGLWVDIGTEARFSNLRVQAR